MSELEREWRHHGLRVHRQSAWRRDFPGLEQGITGRGAARFDPPGDRGARGGAEGAPDGWELLGRLTGIRRIARGKQVHGADVHVCDGERSEGVLTVGEADALVTAQDDLLLAITVADCVPVFLIDPARRLAGLVHAGWRGTAAGVVSATVARMADLGADPAGIHAHLGPAICGACYEVGPDVVEALGLPSGGTRHVDLRAQIQGELAVAGIPEARVSASSGCTRCQMEDYYSYRGGDRERRMCAFLGWLPR